MFGANSYPCLSFCKFGFLVSFPKLHSECNSSSSFNDQTPVEYWHCHMHMKALKSLQYFDHNTQSISYKLHSSKKSWSFQNSHLKRVQLNPLSCFLSAFCKGRVIPFQSCALWAEMMRGLNNLCADFFCTESDGVFSGTVFGMGKHQMCCDREMWSKMETFKFRLESQSMSRSSSEVVLTLRWLHRAWGLRVEGKWGMKSLNQEGRLRPCSTKLCVW